MKENNKILVSVIIPTYKRSSKIEEAIKCVLNQTYKNLEIIIVDDNFDQEESLKTYKIVEKYMRKNENIKYLKNEKNLGGALSRNNGLVNSNGKYVAFLDDDDEFYPKKIENQLLLAERKNLDICYCYADVLNENGKILKKIRNKLSMSEKIFEKNLISILITTSGLFFKKDSLVKIGGFKKLICGQEYELLIRALDKDLKIDCVEEELYSFIDHKEERITNNKKRIVGIDELFLIKKHYFNKVSEETKKIIEVNYLLEKISIYLEFREFKLLSKLFLKKTFYLIFNFRILIILILKKREEIKRRILKKIN